jgi:hypothetical protein
MSYLVFCDIMLSNRVLSELTSVHSVLVCVLLYYAIFGTKYLR